MKIYKSDRRMCLCGAEIEAEISAKSQVPMMKSMVKSFVQRHRLHIRKVK